MDNTDSSKTHSVKERWMLRVGSKHFANFCNPEGETVKPFSFWLDVLESLYGRQALSKLEDWLIQRYAENDSESYCDYFWTLNQARQLEIFEDCVAFMEESTNG